MTVDTSPGIEERAWSREEAYSYCAALARAHYENFTVGSLLLPRDKRRHLYAIYGFCRFADDLGDEARGERLTLLQRREEELELCYSGTPRHPIMLASRTPFAPSTSPGSPSRS